MPAPITLVCDDCHALCDWSSTLRHQGYVVATYTDPLKALDDLETAKSIRVLVTCIDFGPGKPNGIALGRMVKYKRPGVQVIFAADPQLAPHTEGLGELKKWPVSGKELLATVHNLAGGGLLN